MRGSIKSLWLWATALIALAPLVATSQYTGASQSGLFAPASQTRWHRSILDAEIQHSERYIELLQAKVALLTRTIAHLQNTRSSQLDRSRANGASDTSHRRPGSRASNFERKRLDDWFAPQSVWSPGAESSNATSSRRRSSSSHTDMHVEMISFRASGNSGGGKKASRSFGGDDAVAGNTQFLLVINRQSGALDLYHPLTRELVWQQRLHSRSRISKVLFQSERAAHLVLLTDGGEMLMYKIRVFHGRRQLSGDYRRPSSSDKARCMYHVLVRDALNPHTSPRVHIDPLRPHDHEISRKQRTIAPAGYHLHFEFEFVFRVAPPTPPVELTLVTYHQSMHIVTSSAHGQLSFFHGVNGLLIQELPDRHGTITQFEALASGVVAFAVANRIRFVDVIDRRLLPLKCEGSTHAITSMSRDYWRSTVLYVGTADGRSLVFRLNRFGQLRRNNGLVAVGVDTELDDSDVGIPACVLTAQLQSRYQAIHDSSLAHTALFAGDRPAPLLQALPGYLLFATHATRLVLYETATSRAGVPSYLAEKQLSHLWTSHRGARIVMLSGAKDLHTSPTAVAIVTSVTPGTAPRVELLASHVPAPPSSFDLGWVRAPIMLLCAVGVMFWQQNRFRRAPSSTSGMEFDFDLPQKLRSKHSDWSKSFGAANHRSRRF